MVEKLNVIFNWGLNFLSGQVDFSYPDGQDEILGEKGY